MPDKANLSLDVEETIRFFDEKPDWGHKQATAIVAMLGEDLAVSTFQHCLETRLAAEVNPRTESVLPGSLKGPRLDRWIEVDWSDGSRTLFQAEIKSTSAYGTGGKQLGLNATCQEATQYKHDRWSINWDNSRRAITWKEAAKVLVPMKPSFKVTDRIHLPLLIVWAATAPGPECEHKDHVEGGHLFSIPKPNLGFQFELSTETVSEHPFPELWVFSVSSYLRSLPDKQIALDMPTLADRLQIIQRLVPSSMG